MLTAKNVNLDSIRKLKYTWEIRIRKKIWLYRFQKAKPDFQGRQEALTEKRCLENAAIEPAAGFHNLGLSPASLAALEHVNYQTPSPIQAAFIPKAVGGGDCIGQARTGTGKTAAFVLPILERIVPDQPIVQAIVLTPTRELSEQVAVECRRHHTVRQLAARGIGRQRFRGGLVFGWRATDPGGPGTGPCRCSWPRS